MTKRKTKKPRTDCYYRYDGRRYVPVQEWPNEVEPGLWLVYQDNVSKGRRRVDWIADQKSVSMATGAAFERHWEAITRAISRTARGVWSFAEVADAVIRVVIEEEARGK